MKTSPIKHGKLLLSRDAEERKPIIERLNRIEGQVRGVKAMIEADRYCGDELLQIKAAIAGLRKVAMILSQQHIAAAAAHLAVKKQVEIAQEDIMRILETALEI